VVSRKILDTQKKCFKKKIGKTGVQPAKTSANLNNWAKFFAMHFLTGISYFLLKYLNLDHCALEM